MPRPPRRREWRRHDGSGRSRGPVRPSARLRPATIARSRRRIASTSCRPAARWTSAASSGSPSRPNARAKAARSAPSVAPIAARGTANQGFSAGDAQSTVTSRPPGTRTRRSSRNVAVGSSAAMSESRLVTASNDASANVSGRLKSASRSVSRAPAASRAAASLLQSLGARVDAGDLRPATARATVSRPLPQPASSTRGALADGRENLRASRTAEARAGAGRSGSGTLFTKALYGASCRSTCSRAKRIHSCAHVRDDARSTPSRSRASASASGATQPSTSSTSGSGTASSSRCSARRDAGRRRRCG